MTLKYERVRRLLRAALLFMEEANDRRKDGDQEGYRVMMSDASGMIEHAMELMAEIETERRQKTA